MLSETYKSRPIVIVIPGIEELGFAKSTFLPTFITQLLQKELRYLILYQDDLINLRVRFL